MGRFRILECDWCAARAEVGAGDYDPREWDDRADHGLLCPECCERLDEAVKAAVAGVRSVRTDIAERRRSETPRDDG